MSKLRQIIRNIFLKGCVARWWFLRRAKQIDDAYLNAISDTEPCNASLYFNSKPSIRTSSSLKRLLFIGDCMWEQEQLFPGIRKICALDVLDLHPFLQTASNPSCGVITALQSYALDKSREPDVIIFYARPAILSEEAFSIIRQRWSCPLFGMNLDDRVEFFPYGILKSGNDNYARWVRSFDVNLTSSLTALDWYARSNAQAHYLPQGFCPSPRFATPPDKVDFHHRFTFVGSLKPERCDLISNLKRYGIHPEIFGKGWPHGQWIEDPLSVFRTSQLNLGIGYALASARIANAKGRDIECPATGACYLTTYHWELAEMFEIGKEVLCYRNVEELIELYTYYSKRPENCLRIARAAHRRAHEEHTWEKRLRDLFGDLGFQLTQ